MPMKLIETLSSKTIGEVMSVLMIPEVVEDPYLWMTTRKTLWYEIRKCNAGDQCMVR